MPEVLIASGIAQADVDPGPVTAGPYNLTGQGVDLIIGFVGIDNTGGSGTANSFYDSLSNTYTALTLRNFGSAAIQPYYCINPTVGNAMLFNGTGRRPAMIFQAWASGGTVTFDLESGGHSPDPSTGITLGIITSGAGIIAGAMNAGQNARTITGVNSGFTLDQTVTGSYYATGDIYLVTASSVFTGPTISLNANENSIVGAIVSFLVSGGGGATSPMRLPLLGVN